MENPDQLKEWLFQQRDSYRSFFAAQLMPYNPRISCLIENPAITYEGAGPLEHAYIGKFHCRKSSSIQLRFQVDRVLKYLRVPAPGDDGVFIINGTPCAASIQRLVWSTKPLCDEYRRIDQVLLDGWSRRRNEKGAKSDSKELFSHRELTATEPADKAFARLCGYLLRSLVPTLDARRQPDGLLHVFEGNNKWGVLAEQTQVKTFAVTHEQESKRVCVTTPYRWVELSSMLGDRARQPAEGLDVFHTPEGDKVGLTRHLTRGTFIGDDRNLKPGADPCAPGFLASCVPFAQHNDGRRILMACGMMTKAVPVTHAAPSSCPTDFDRLVRKIPGLTEDLGVSLRVGFLFWEGLNYEDAVVVSRSAAEKLSARVERIISIPVPCYCSVKGAPRVGKVSKDDPLVKLTYSPLRLGLRIPVGLPDALRSKDGFFPEEVEFNDPALRSPCSGIIERVEVVDLLNDDCPGVTRYSHRLDFKICVDRPLQIGDKLCNLHGNKGVVSAILPEDEMPQVDGKPLEILFNPIGIINRGNYGQILEALASQKGECMVSPDVCEGLTERVRAITQADGTSPLCSSVTYQRGGVAYKVNAITGCNYILRLPHYAGDSMKVCADTAYSNITGQPPQGIGQSYGEMEIAALQAHGAHAILQEICCDRSRQDKISPSPSLQDWMHALGFGVVRQDDRAAVTFMNLSGKPKKHSDLFAKDLKTEGDAECNVDDRDKTLISLSVLRRRLSSTPFFNDHGPIYIDLGKQYPLKLDSDEVEGAQAVFELRYLPVLHPKYRPASLTSGGMDDATKLYAEVLRALWSEESKQGSSDTVDAVGRLARYLLRRHKGKHGIIRRVGLSRRLTFSSRFVIIPGPDLAIDQVSLPWDAVRVLYKKCLLHNGIPQEILDQDQVSIDGASYAVRIDSILQKEWVLLNRPPSLHKYNVMAFRPRVHFNSYALRIPPLVCPPYGADHDGDQMSVLSLFSEEAKEEAVRLSFFRNITSVADGAPLMAPTKDFRLGLWLVCLDSEARAAMNGELREKGLPTFIGASSAGAGEMFSSWIQDNKFSGAGNNVADALLIVTTHALHALRRHVNQSCFGSFETMKSFWAPFCESRSAKKDKFEEEGPRLISGLSPVEMRSKGIESVKVLVEGKLTIGDFGGYRRNLYYRIISQACNGLAFDGDMRQALDAIGSITERATQKALSAKSGVASFGFDNFKKSVEAALGGEDSVADLIKATGLAQADLMRHLDILRRQVVKADQPLPFLQFLAKPFEDIQQEITGQATDPRIAVFLS